MSEIVLGLAPQAGITDWPMRALCYRYGANYACTEMVSAIGWMSAHKSKPVYEAHTLTHPSEYNTACQLFGKDPVVMAEAAARACELGRFTSLDINMGCPARKVVASGDGSALLKTPDLAARIMEAVRKNSTLPVTVKTRLGFDSESMNAPLLVQAAQDAGLQWVTLHGRTREQQYSGHADYAAIAAIKREARIPIIANGDVFTPDDAVRILAETGCDGLMIGRGAQGNPWLFRGCVEALAGKPVTPVTLEQRLAVTLEHLRWMVDYKGEHWGVIEIRKHVGHYIAGLRGASAARRALTGAKTAAELEARLRTLFQSASQGE